MKHLCFLCLVSFVPVAEAEKDWSGTYVMFQQATSVTKLPILKDVVAKMKTTMIVQFSQNGEKLVGTGKICDMHMESNSNLVQTTFPPAFRRAIPPVRIDAVLKKRGRHLHFYQRETTVVLGARLENPKKERLPEDAQDVRVMDHDRDGHPGVTVNISGLISGSIYLVQRSSSRLQGKRHGEGFRGQLIFTNEQNVLGASKALLKRDPGAEPDLSKSYFRMEPVASSLDCSGARRMVRTFE